MADPIRCVYAMEDGYFCAKHSNAFYDASCRLLDGESCEDQKLPKPMTNADRIRSMSDEELAKLLDHDCPPRSALDVCPQYESGKPYTQEGCYQCRLAWLKQEVSDAL